MKIGDLVLHRDRSWKANPEIGIITGIQRCPERAAYGRSHFTFVDVLWSDKHHPILGYMLNELRAVDESR